MSDNKINDMTNYYVEFLEQVGESTIKAFSTTAEVCSGFMEAMYQSGQEECKGTKMFGNPAELKEIYKNTLDHWKQVMEPFFSIHPNYPEIASLATASAEKGFDVQVYLYSLCADFYEKLMEVSRDGLKACRSMATCSTVSDPKEFINKWTDIPFEVLSKVADSSDFMEAVPGFIARYTDFLKSNMDLQKKILEPTYVTKKELEEVAEDIKTIKLMLEKKLNEPLSGENEKKSSVKQTNKKK